MAGLDCLPGDYLNPVLWSVGEVFVANERSCTVCAMNFEVRFHEVGNVAFADPRTSSSTTGRESFASNRSAPVIIYQRECKWNHCLASGICYSILHLSFYPFPSG